jgi:hypothetical protein
MRFVRPIFLAAIVVALAAYGFDCQAMVTPDETMQCCDTMPCPPHGHESSGDCCKTMPSIQSPFVQPTAHNVSVSLVFFAVLPVVSTSQGLGLSTQVVLLAAHSHAPPIPQAATPSPLRI